MLARALLSACLALTATVRAKCPASWDEYDKNCYLFVKDVEVGTLSYF